MLVISIFDLVMSVKAHSILKVVIQLIDLKNIGYRIFIRQY